MKTLKCYRISFVADEKFGKNKWSNEIQFSRTVFATGYKQAIRKAEQREFQEMICSDKNDNKNFGLTIKYRNIEVTHLEIIAEESL